MNPTIIESNTSTSLRLAILRLTDNTYVVRNLVTACETVPMSLAAARRVLERAVRGTKVVAS